jgi:PUA domain protein
MEEAINADHMDFRANIMAPGLTSPGGAMDDVPAETPVLVAAEGKENALALGLAKLSTQDMYCS